MYLQQKRRHEKKNQGEGPETQAEEAEAIDLVRSDEEEEAPEEGPNELENKEEAKT